MLQDRGMNQILQDIDHKLHLNYSVLNLDHGLMLEHGVIVLPS